MDLHSKHIKFDEHIEHPDNTEEHKLHCGGLVMPFK